jgi:hypothetical protein
MTERGLGIGRRMEEVAAEAVGELLAGRGGQLRGALSEEVDHAKDRAYRLACEMLGREPPDPGGGGGGGGGRGGDRADGGDPPAGKSGGRGPSLQHRLTGALDAAALQTVLEGLVVKPEAAAAKRHRRLADLGSKDTVHSWLWAVNPAHGFVLHPDAYVTALRLRLGIDVSAYEGEEPCGECGILLTAADAGNHALLCARGKRTTGHNRIRDLLADLARASDGSAQTEVPWAPAACAPDPPLDERRPADILTSAAPLGGVGFVAIDVGITTPMTQEGLKRAGVDVLEAYCARKIAKNTDAATAAKWQYRPVIISAFGRRHAEATNVVHRLAMAAARRYGVKPAQIESAWWRNCTTLLMERASMMVERCRPTVRLPCTLGGVDEDAAGAEPHARRRRRTDGDGAWVGADEPTAPEGE